MSSFVDGRRHADAAGTAARTPLTAAVIRVGGIEIDMRRHEIRRDGETIRLQQQPFQILALLMEHAGGVVTRADIERRLWPDGTSVDFEHSVNAAIRRLRVALGDDALEPRFVETVPRRGYRFVGRVDPAGRLDERRPLAVVRPRVLVRPFQTHGDAPVDALGAALIEELVAQLAHRGADRVDVLTRPPVPVAGPGPARPCYRIEGSVRVAGDRVRVLATLIDCRDETHRWANGFDRQVDDPLGATADVAAAIADAVVGRLAPAAPALPVRPVPVSEALPVEGAAATAWSRREWAMGIVTSGTRWSSALTR